MQQQLKPLCAKVRNEYSTEKLQADFREGLEEMLRESDENSGVEGASSSDDAAAAAAQNPLPDDFVLDVFCVSANDYLKVSNIKSKSDGPPACFQEPAETNIPALRAFVHQTTVRQRKAAAHSTLQRTSDLVDELQLCLADNAEVSAGVSAVCLEAFEAEMRSLKERCDAHCTVVVYGLEQQVESVLKPKVSQGAAQGRQASSATVDSWGSTDYRTKEARNGGGLKWPTYRAVVARDGAFSGGKCGAIFYRERGWSLLNRRVSKAMRWQVGNVQKRSVHSIPIPPRRTVGLRDEHSRVGVTRIREFNLRS